MTSTRIDCAKYPRLQVISKLGDSADHGLVCSEGPLGEVEVMSAWVTVMVKVGKGNTL